MILKNLELVGFKSFVDSTRLSFDNGFTIIVGPNGCGKSNVSDAIRWVIGEQSSKTLRGTRTADLIFSGSESRKPVNRTEISLTLANVPPGIRIANVPNLGEEIRVTRCYHRSGESEFFINQIPCRLKDISDLFLDLGISPKVLTVIEQTHINHIITSKPEERRILIEEAAGILKFKQRKNEALRKLEASGQNLARISDIVQELARQVESLKRQAAKADRYKKYQVEIKGLSLALFAQKIRQYQVLLEQVEEEYVRQSEQKAELSAQASTLDNQIILLKTTIDEFSTALYQKKEAIHSLSTQIAKSENTIEIKQHQIEQAKLDNNAAEAEIAQMNEEIKQLLAEVDFQRRELAKVSEEINAQDEVCIAKSKAIEDDRESLRYKEESVRLGEKQVFNLYHQVSQKKNDLTALETRRHFLESKDHKLKNELDETGALVGQTKTLLSEADLEYTEKVRQFELAKNCREATQAQVAESRQKLKENAERLHAAKDTWLKQSSLLHSLKELRRNFGGFEEGVKALMTQNSDGQRLSGLREVLVDILQAPAEFEKAIEAVLGERLQSVIVNSYSDTVAAINYLKSASSGRGSFIPMTPKTLPLMPLSLNGTSGIMGKAVDVVRCKEGYRSVLEHLLSNVVVVEDFDTALYLHASEGFQGTVVTRNGEVIDAQGVVTGGESKGGGSSLLAQNREMEQLSVQVTALKEELDAAQSGHDGQMAKLAELEESFKNAQASVHQAEIVATNSRRDLEQLQKELQRLEQKSSTLDYERYSSVQEMQELSIQQASLIETLAAVEVEKNKEETALTTLRADLEREREELQKKSADLSAIKILIEALKGKRDNILREIKRNDQQQESLRQRISKREDDKRSNAEKAGRLQLEIGETEQRIMEQVREKDALNEEAVREDEDLRQREDQLKQMEKDSRAFLQQVQEIAESVNKLEVKRSEIKINAAHIAERAYGDFNVTLEEMLDNYQDQVEETEAEETLKDLKDKIARMGEVNLAALSDFEQTNARYTFLKKQEEDLALSIKLLHETIAKIDSTTKQRFQETFDLVNENFKQCFSRLFEGGRAELILVDEANPLETGIDIIAQPAGKKNQSINLLSQGEKAMTAVALMFSLFKVRPSPFCLLDEVDAPLDEANVIRFQSLLREMSDKTQFIIITHNQKTMSFADVLYGVTMEEKGVSKVVSVHLNN